MGDSVAAADPKRVETIVDLRALCASYRVAGERIALVPTMGYLHEGHLSLVRAGKARADRVIVSIYVNPTQFGANEDLDTYPRDIEGDIAKLAACGVDAVFLPSSESMYPDGASTWVTVEGLTRGLCGASRPTHFQGVTTIVAKFFTIIAPDVAVFGQKDFQQLQVIRRMTMDLFLPVEIVGAPIVREPDGLAMSSRNAYLNQAQRAAAPAIHRALVAAAERFTAGERDAQAVRSLVASRIEAEDSLRCDYVEIVDANTLAPLGQNGLLPDHDVHIAVAVFAGSTRLIDNLSLSSSLVGGHPGAGGVHSGV